MHSNLLPQPATTDVLIIGGGPAGLAAAIAMRQRGLQCVVVEACPPAIDKACGEGLMPDSQAVLAQLGIVLTEADGRRFHGIRFANASHAVEGNFPAGIGIGVRRPHLHSLLAARAQQLGAHLLWESHVQLAHESCDDSARPPHTDEAGVASVNGRPLRYRWLVGADGQASTVRRWAGLDDARRSLRFGFRAHCRVDAGAFDMVEVHWGRSGQLYITPVAPDCVCVVHLTRDPQHGKHGPQRSTDSQQANNPQQANMDLLQEFPAVARRLAGPHGMQIVSRQRGAVSATCRLRRVTSGHVALIGDASGSADSITGEGLAVSFRQALALADAVSSNSLAGYERAHREIGRLPHAMGALLLTLDRWPGLQVRAMRALADTPVFFHELLEAHVGARSLVSVLLRRGPRFGLALLTAGRAAGPGGPLSRICR